MSDSNFALEDDTTLILAFITWWAVNGTPRTRPAQSDVRKFLLSKRNTYAMERTTA